MQDMIKYRGAEQEFLSAKEFAALIGVHYNTVIRAIKSRKLNAFRINASTKSSYRIPRTEIHRIALFDLEGLITKIIEEKNK